MQPFLATRATLISHETKSGEVWFAIPHLANKAWVGHPEPSLHRANTLRRATGPGGSEVKTKTSEYKTVHSGLDKYVIVGILKIIIL